jgi:hypothetical protein
MAGRWIYSASLLCTSSGRRIKEYRHITSPNDKLYSAWWYDNGISHTTNQFEWRWNLVMGSDPYVLVNVTCSSKDKLSNEVRTIFQQQTLLPFFKK